MSRLSVPLLLAAAACGKEPKPEGSCDEPGHICTWAGVPLLASFGADGIPATESGAYLVQDLRFWPDGDAYFLDWNNHRIRRVSPDGIVQTVAGSGFLGDGPEGMALAASFNHPTSIDVHPTDPNIMAIAAWHNSRIEILHLDTGIIEWIGGQGDRDYNGDNIPAEEASLDLPSSVAFGPDGSELFLMDQANQLIREIGPDGIIHDIAGRQRDPGYFGDGGPAKDAVLHAAVGQLADPSNRIVVHGNELYTVDTQNNLIRVIDLETRIINLVAGQLQGGYAGDGGPAEDALFNLPRDLAFGIDGELYVADTDNSCVRVIGTDGVVETFAGQCASDGSTQGYEGDGGPATEALLDRPFGVEVDGDGNVYVADTHNHIIRKITR